MRYVCDICHKPMPGFKVYEGHMRKHREAEALQHAPIGTGLPPEEAGSVMAADEQVNRSYSLNTSIPVEFGINGNMKSGTHFVFNDEDQLNEATRLITTFYGKEVIV